MLNENGVEFDYREYTEAPLGVSEIRSALKALGKSAKELLRTRDAKKLEIDSDLSDEELIQKMAEHPTLLQRPILIKRQGKKVVGAALGRPVENLAALLSS